MTSIEPLSYEDGHALTHQPDLDVQREDGRVRVTWPSSTPAAQRLTFALEFFNLTTYAVLAGVLPRAVLHLLGQSTPGVARIMLPTLAAAVIGSTRTFWTALRHPGFRQYLAVEGNRLTFVRMGFWSPRLIDRPLSDVTGMSWGSVRRPFRRTSDAWRLTLRFNTGRPLAVLVHAKDPRVPTAVWAGLRALLPGR